jgi:hypothetical protein
MFALLRQLFFNCWTWSLRLEKNLLTVNRVRFAFKTISFYRMCSLRFENNYLTVECVRFASISKKKTLSKFSFAFVSISLPLLSLAEYSFTQDPNKLWRSNSIFNLFFRWATPFSNNSGSVRLLKSWKRLIRSQNCLANLSSGYPKNFRTIEYSCWNFIGWFLHLLQRFKISVKLGFSW